MLSHPHIRGVVTFYSRKNKYDYHNIIAAESFFKEYEKNSFKKYCEDYIFVYTATDMLPQTNIPKLFIKFLPKEKCTFVELKGCPNFRQMKIQKAICTETNMD